MCQVRIGLASAVFLLVIASGGKCETERKPRLDVLVCIPTMMRRGSHRFFEQVIAAVRNETSQGLHVQILVMHDARERPEGGDLYLQRVQHNISAPCTFLLWRRRLIADFVHLMTAALEQASAGAVDYIMWLEDDAVLHAGWSAALNQKIADSCMLALHECNCHSCDAAGNYNGVGMVASVFHTRKLKAVLHLMSTRTTHGVTALDTMVYEVCRDAHLGSAMFHMPPVVTHMGDIVVTSTKPVPNVNVKITSPAYGSRIQRPLEGRKPLDILFHVSNLVYDAEYSWAANVTTNYSVCSCLCWSPALLAVVGVEGG